MEDVDELVCKTGGRNCCLTQLADHDGIHHVNADIDKTLQGDR